MDYLLTYADRGFSGNPQDTGNDRTYSLDVLPQEFPCRLTGDFRSPVLDLVNADGSFGCDLRYQGYEICDGKYNLKGLPAVYAAEEEAQTLIIYMKDQVTGLQVELLYGVLPEYDVITRSAKVINTEEDKIRLTKAQMRIDNIFGVILCYLVFYMPMNVLLYSGYLKNIPMALEEAAHVDGATTWKLTGALFSQS